MSLVSVKHLYAPFTNKVHWVTLILVGVLFAVFRLSGGGVHLRPTFTPPRANLDRNVAPVDIEETQPTAQRVYEQERSTDHGTQGYGSMSVRKQLRELGVAKSNRTIPDNNAIEDEEMADELLQQMMTGLQKGHAKPPVKANSKQAEPKTSGLDGIEKQLGLK